MHRRVDLHRRLIWVVVGDLLVHLEEVAVFGGDDLTAQVEDLFLARIVDALHIGLCPAVSADRIGEVEEDRFARAVDAQSGIAALLGCPGGHIAWNQISEGRITAFQIIISTVFGDVHRLQAALANGLCIFFVGRDPDPSVISQRLRHQGELGLQFPIDRDASRVDLCEAGIGHGSALLVGLPCSRHIGSHGVGGQEKDVAVTTGAQKHGVGTVAFQFSGDQVAGDDPSRLSVDHHKVHHLVSRIHLHLALGDLALQCGIRAEQQLLTGLSLCIKSSAHLNATKRTVVEQTSIIAGEGDTLGHTLVDDAG